MAEGNAGLEELCYAEKWISSEDGDPLPKPVLKGPLKSPGSGFSISGNLLN